MKLFVGLLSAGLVLAGGLSFASPSYGQAVVATPRSPALDIQSTQIQYLEELDLLVFEQQLAGVVGATLPQSAGQLDGAPVLGYVFPTTLSPAAVGFGGVDGILALAVTSHPDFDDTPLWDEDNDADYANDGVIWHTHWVVLTGDNRVPGGLSVAEFAADDASVVMPPTNPGMTIYLDSPGFSVVTDQETLRVLVPAQRVDHNTDFNFDAVTAYMQVNTSDASRPTLGVYEVYSVGSGDLSLPYGVRHDAD
ncbi:hypothetical protein [Leptolyngbya iicbica]|uniref:Uncharacterized protein n=2 Tax=Cyanophyceae TaxID=3028117 RepID=A0A4Q7E3A1_9CYAN|nr:hypothetical protein [Leptolyngbya sp. LK]RZM77136.1 hypothetical protein DYY88_15910 [Leptolyngbya sp. LK]